MPISFDYEPVKPTDVNRARGNKLLVYMVSPDRRRLVGLVRYGYNGAAKGWIFVGRINWLPVAPGAFPSLNALKERLSLLEKI